MAPAVAPRATVAFMCQVLGMAVGMQRWDAGAQERLFWAICAHERESNPRLTCEFTKPT